MERFTGNIKVLLSYLSMEKVEMILYMNETPLPCHYFDPCSQKLPAIVSGYDRRPNNKLC